ncbi:hypothetical protein ACSBR2_008052 [Camellia fascicularis]
MKKAEPVFIPSPRIGHLVSIVEFAKRLISRDDRFSITIIVIKPPPPFQPLTPTPTHSLPPTHSSNSLTSLNSIHLTHLNSPNPLKTISLFT